MVEKVILDLCGGTGGWSQYYAQDENYDVRIIDPRANSDDVRLMEFDPSLSVHGILAAPPCTHLASSGARWWKEKGEEALLEALSVVDACLRMVTIYEPVWWALENPVGRLTRYLGKPQMYFHPWEYSSYGGEEDMYTKKTALWGEFREPIKAWLPGPVDKHRIHWAAPGPDRWKERSVTPKGFAKAFKEANP